MILFQFQHISIPEKASELAILLDRVALSAVTTCKRAAEGLWAALSSQVTSSVTSALHIDRIKSDWLRSGEPANLDRASLMRRAVFSIHMCLNTKMWQVVRRLTCFSCSYLAAQKLASLVGVLGAVSTEWASELDDLPSTRFEGLRTLTGSLAAASAVNTQTLILTKSAIHPTITHWMPAARVDGLSLLNKFDTASLGPCDFDLIPLNPKPITDETRGVLQYSLPVDVGVDALLLRHKSDNADSKTEWCLLVFDEVNFRDDEAVGRLMVEARRKGGYLKLSKSTSDGKLWSVSKGNLQSEAEIQLVNDWVRQLLG
jgi:hypothetical protein